MDHGVAILSDTEKDLERQADIWNRQKGIWLDQRRYILSRTKSHDQLLHSVKPIYTNSVSIPPNILLGGLHQKT